jgi:C_GCAxxG_C_C family probable redox protein
MKPLLLNEVEKLDPQAETLIEQIKERARNLYETRQMLCAEAVLLAVNDGLGGGLTDTQAIAMAAPFCAAMGESGCICGALSGAVMSSGLLLGNGNAYRHRKQMRVLARQLHDAFKAVNGATCCRVLSKPVKHNKKAHFDHCADLTAHAAELAARFVLKKRPELADVPANGTTARRQSKLKGVFLRLARYLAP